MQFLTEDPNKDKPVKMRTRRQMLATGFASPADHYLEKRLDINDYVVRNPTATFYFRLTSHFPSASKLQQEDVIVVDRSRHPQAGRLAIAVFEGEFIPVQLMKKGNTLTLKSLKSGRMFSQDQELSIWGIITHIIRPTL